MIAVTRFFTQIEERSLTKDQLPIHPHDIHNVVHIPTENPGDGG